MIAFALRRIGTALLVLLAVSVLVFAGCEELPGDVAEVSLGNFASPDNVRALRLEFGLDRPAPLRYADWLVGMTHGDFGRSITTRTPVAKLLRERAANTGILALATTVIAVPVAIGLGLLMALGSGGAVDRIGSVTVLALSTTPEFLIGSVAVLFLAVKLRWLPAIAYIGADAHFGAMARALALPVGTLSVVVSAQIARMTRAIIGNLLGRAFIEMAELKGVGRWRVVGVHALINAIGPLANVVALNMAYLVSGVVVVETIFAYPGLARLMVDAVQARDLPVVQACAMIFCAAYVLLILLADLLALLFDPRPRNARTAAA
jgi:peptide/nickel transport system permease protein